MPGGSALYICVLEWELFFFFLRKDMQIVRARVILPWHCAFVCPIQNEFGQYTSIADICVIFAVQKEHVTWRSVTMVIKWDISCKYLFLISGHL